jgi:hypothetical protein
MTDKELLESAAKAANRSLDDGAFGLLDWWNPLTDDGHALQLAVQLGICISIDRTLGAETEAWAYSEMVCATTEDHGNDPYAATRRAIVKAAANLAQEPKP